MTSPSTLIRQANATKDKQKAAKLRARAAKLRRSIRATKAAGGSARLVTASVGSLRQRNANIDKQIGALARSRPATTSWVGQSAEDRAEMKAQTTGAMVASHDEAKGWSVRESSPMISPERVSSLRKAALKRDPEAFEIGLRALFVDGKVAALGDRADQRKIDEEAAVRRLRDFNEAVHIKVVSSFMARIKGMEAGNQPLPASFVLDGYTAARVYDALRDAGYTTEGKQGGIRKAV